MRSVTTLCSILASLLLVACGDDGGGTGDDDAIDASDEGPNAGFVPPGSVTKANVDEEEVGDADWSCLGTPSEDTPTTVAVTLTGQILDFQNDNQVREATVTVFPGIETSNTLGTATSDVSGNYTLTLPSGHARYGFKVEHEDYMDTFLLNQDFEPANANQSLNISAISTGTATALPAIIGLVRTPNTGVLAGAMRDCQNREVSYAVATVSGSAGTADHLDGAVTYYIDASAGLPVRHDQLVHTDVNGLFAVFELPPSGSAFIQVWGFVDAADLADGEMTLLAELESPVVGETIITGSIEPLRD